MMTQSQYRDAIVHSGRVLYERGFIAATDGNISVRLDDERILITPTCMCKGKMHADDLVIIDRYGRKLEGERNVSSEVQMHLLIYNMRADAQAVVHAHPPTATGFAAAGIALDQPLVSEVVLTLGAVPLAAYGCPGTQALSDSLRPLIPEHDAILMANHGVVTYADDLERAFMQMETVEHFAKITLVARTLGNPKTLDADEVKKLTAIRRQMEAARMEANERRAKFEVVNSSSY
ncbi:MAG TPA: class II aldolase/adducin family protein [Terriglobales bacterium]|jgi:L-fuculose-phosphate aldolase|nr:class II aldolase/adducin family protein [Terriglobales bacterium]